jgi:hypothetical protein
LGNVQIKVSGAGRELSGAGRELRDGAAELSGPLWVLKVR